MTPVRSLLRTAGFAGLYVIAAYAGRLTVMDGTNLSLVWPAAGVSAVWFLAQRTSRYRWADVLALSAVTMAVNMATGASATLSLFFVAANLAQAFVFVLLFRRWLGHLWGGGGDRPLARLHELWRLVAASLLSTASGALIGPTGVWVINGVYSWSATAVWMTRNTVSILLIGTAGIRLGHLLHQHFAVHRRSTGGLRTAWTVMPFSRKGEYLAVVVLSAAGYYAVFGADHGLPLAFVVLVMTVWAGLRLHTAFVIVHDVTFGSAAVLFTLHHSGVFASIAEHATRALVAQLFVGIIAVVGLALALGRDERTALIDDLRAERHAAAGQAELMTAIIDAMSEGLTVIDERGRFLLRNSASRRLLGGVVSATETLAKPDFYGLFHPDGTPMSVAEMPHRRALAGEDVAGVDILVRNAGIPEGRIVSVSSVALTGRREGHRCAVTVFHDVTAERRHRDELSAFAGVVAHDLLNPLATIDGWTGLLTGTFDDAPDDPIAVEAADGMHRIQRAADRMRHMINDLLAYTTARDATIRATDVDLGAVVTDIASARIDQARSNRAVVPLFRLADMHHVHADRALVRQLLDNLISNGIKYVADGVVPELTIGTAIVDGMVAVTVADNGIGIPAGEHENIFDNFHRAHRTAEYAGTGLGLGICKRIVERHGGAITVTGNPDGPGSRFTFTLPADDSTTAPPAPQHRRTTDGDARPARERREPVIAPAPDGPAEPPGEGFQQTARLVLDYLHDEMPLAFWAITRVEDGRQSYLYLDADNGYGLRQGDSHPWEDSYCSHMAAGRAPAVAADARAVPAYAKAAINDVIDIGTYAGAVITEPDGTLFGAICGLDPQTQAADSRIARAEPLLALLGHLLTTALAADRAQDRATHAMLREHLSAETDALTGLPNRRAWHRLLDEARSRYERLADPTAVAMLDLDNLKAINDGQGHAAGDAYIAAAATAVRAALRDTDIVARLGGDEFGLLLPRCTTTDADLIIARVYAALDAAGVSASIGWAPVTMQAGFDTALAQADAAMYATKHQRQRSLPTDRGAP
ncbi:diguanylate cyclase (GGDEF)-like protein [Catenuloplanes nepalensis]|uniref:Sensor-like histidine kinase SenX3 n=1 Tax=Catenuloplanes nepalensis TaxID=587533 RepID=A0ABT9MUE9_9ACTN|nr:diguanylate cyclase [Catenuloplanes nepalensis]MDP9794883.1 diguanylate cyclase (GGDEF)-like protein [Catenuloplanes nepalensis]